MNSLWGQLGGMLLATAVAAGISALGAWFVVGEFAVLLSLLAAAISLPVGVAVVIYFHRAGLTAESIVASTMIRVFLTSLLAGLAAWMSESVRVPVFFLALAIIYLANLGVETWFVLKKSSTPRRIGTST